MTTDPPRFQKRLTPTQAARLLTDLANGMTNVEAARVYGVSTSTVYRIKYDKYPPKSRRQPCGTNAAYARHIRNRERPCPECCEAHARTQKEWHDGRETRT